MSETPDPTRLMELAKAATPGPWTYRHEAWDHPFESASVLGRPDGNKITYVHFGSNANAAFVAAANPVVVLALLTELADLQAENARLTAAHDALWALLYRGAWHRDQEGRTHLAVQVADHADLSCRATVQDAVNAALAALTPKGEAP